MLDLGKEGLSHWPGASWEGKTFSLLCVGSAESEQDEQAQSWVEVGQKSVTVQNCAPVL